MKIACYTDIHNQQTMLNMPTVLRQSAVAAAEQTAAEWGKADISIVGGDNISDYPYWDRSCALPYENWLDIDGATMAYTLYFFPPSLFLIISITLSM